MLDRDLIINYIEYGIECDNLDFKSDIYDFKDKQKKQDFIEDVMSFANAHSLDDKYIIIGVMIKRDGTRNYRDVDATLVQDGAVYQSLITNNIEPTIVIDFDIVEHKNIKFGVFKISKTNRDRPYLLSKQYDNLKKGHIRIRKGQQNVEVVRRDFELFCKEKNVEKKSEIKVIGIIDGNNSNCFRLENCSMAFDNKTLTEKINTNIAEVNKIIVQAAVEDKKTLNFGDLVEFQIEDKDLIEQYAAENKIHLNPNFFELGDLRHYTMSQFTGTTYYGSDDAKKKYELINNIVDDMTDFISREIFNDEILKVIYTELAIENSGKVFDEDIEVCLAISKKDYLDFKKFPVPYGDTINTVIDNGVLERYINIQKFKNISQYRSKDRKIYPIAPAPYKLPIVGWDSPSYDSLSEYYYSLINCDADYEILENEDEIVLKYTQKDIKPNEIVSLPTKIFFQNSIERITYSIKTKHNPDIMSGEIMIEKRMIF